MNDFNPNIKPANMPRKFWQCQNSSCAKVIPNPLRWVIGAKTKFACPYCRSNVAEIKDDK